MVRFNCSGCRVVLKAADRHVGAAMPCPNCGRRLFVPGPLPAGASVLPPSRLPLMLGGAAAALLLVVVVAGLFAFPYLRGGRPGPAQASAGAPSAGAAAPSLSKSAGPGAPAGPADAERPEGRKYALLVGVKTYKKDELKSLQFTENDVNEIAPVLQEAGYRRVVLMTQSEAAAQGDGELQPTAKNIRKKFQGLLEDLKPEDSILVAFSGHGVQFKEDRGSYFCPMDTELADRTTMVSLAEIYKGLEECKADLKVLLVDACRNDPLSSLNKGVDKVNVASVTGPQTERLPGGVAALFSCSEGQQSYESPALKHGIFFHFVIQGLKGKAANKRGEVTLGGLAAYVNDEVPVQIKQDIGEGVRQVPHLVSDLSGAATLVRIAVAAKTEPATTEPAATETKPKDPGPTATKDKPPEGTKPPDKPTGSVADNAAEKAAAAVRKLGGKLRVDANLPGQPVVEVDLSGTEVADADLKDLAGLKHLQKLNLSTTSISGRGLKDLAGLKELRELDLYSTGVMDSEMKDLGSLKTLQTLRIQVPVGTGQVGITGAGLTALAGLNDLTSLDLSDNVDLIDASLVHLAPLKGLQTLKLKFTNVTNAGLRNLAAVKSLKSLDLHDCPSVTDAGINELQQALPNVSIEH